MIKLITPFLDFAKSLGKDSDIQFKFWFNF